MRSRPARRAAAQSVRQAEEAATSSRCGPGPAPPTRGAWPGPGRRRTPRPIAARSLGERHRSGAQDQRPPPRPQDQRPPQPLPQDARQLSPQPQGVRLPRMGIQRPPRHRGLAQRRLPCRPPRSCGPRPPPAERRQAAPRRAIRARASRRQVRARAGRRSMPARRCGAPSTRPRRSRPPLAGSRRCPQPWPRPSRRRLSSGQGGGRPTEPTGRAAWASGVQPPRSSIGSPGAATSRRRCARACPARPPSPRPPRYRRRADSACPCAQPGPERPRPRRTSPPWAAQQRAAQQRASRQRAAPGPAGPAPGHRTAPADSPNPRRPPPARDRRAIPPPGRGAPRSAAPSTRCCAGRQVSIPALPTSPDDDGAMIREGHPRRPGATPAHRPHRRLCTVPTRSREIPRCPPSIDCTAPMGPAR